MWCSDHVLVTVRLLGTSAEVVLKKLPGTGTEPSGKPPKVNRTETVPCRTMQWKSNICPYSMFVLKERGICGVLSKPIEGAQVYELGVKG